MWSSQPEKKKNDPEKKKKNKETSKDVMDKKKQEFLAACNGSVGKAMDKRWCHS
jgi:hypothetical protein